MAKLLNWVDFQRKFVKNKIFTPLDVRRGFGVSTKTATLAIHRYHKRGLVERLRRGFYTFPDLPVSDLYLASRLYEPSYISLEFALSYYGIILEAVYTITSVTSKATRTFRARGQTFSYHRLKTIAFTGYRVAKQSGFSFYLADPEKAFVDLTYLRLRSGGPPVSRFHKEKLNARRAIRYANLFGNAKLVAVVTTSLR